MDLQDILTLYDYNYWAHHRILEVVQSLSHEQFSKDMGSSHGGIHGTLFHAMAAERVWLRRWQGTSPTGLGDAAECPTSAALNEHWQSVEREMMDFCRSMKGNDDLRRMIRYKDLKGNEQQSMLHPLMQHLVNHSTYHRGQVVVMLRQLGVKPVGTDLVNYFRKIQSS